MITVKEVHADFVTAQERIVEEVKRIINTPHGELIYKGNRLAALGFNRSKDAVIAQEISMNSKSQRELLGLIQAYNQRYPYNPFITEKEVEKLCKKYGLVLGDADRFTGEIPEKNLEEIENFKLLKEDLQEKFYSFGHGIHVPDIIYGPHGFQFRNRNNFQEERVERIKPPFKIVASYQDFDTSDTSLEGYRLEEKLPDPIVLQPVKGGYLIVSKWGEEASDELVTNPKMN